MALLGLAVGAVGVGDLAQMPHEPTQLGRIQPAGGLEQDRFGLGGDVGGEPVGAVGHHPA